MIVYLSTIFIILILGAIYSGLEAKNKLPYRRHYIIGVSVLLILQSGLRNLAVGADTYAYFKQFEKVTLYTWSNILDIITDYYGYGIGKDPGYVVFQKFVQYLLPNYQLFLILIAVIFFSAMGNFIYQNTNRLSDAILAYVLYSCLFFSFFSITGHRQTIATAAALYGYELIKKRKFVPFLLLIILASTIHRSVLIFIPFYFIATLKKTGLYYSAILLLFPVLMIYQNAFCEFIVSLGNYEQYGIFEERGTYIFTSMLLLVAAVALWKMKAVIRKNKETRPIYNAFALAVFLTPLTWVNPSAMRAVQYYSIFMLVLVPAVINSLEVNLSKLQKIPYLVTVVILIVLFVRANIEIEYRFFWQTMKLGENYWHRN
jgi:hypothetical protein